MDWEIIIGNIYSKLGIIGIKLFWSVVVIAAASISVKLITKQFDRERKKNILDPTVKNYLKSTVKAVIYVIAAVIIVSITGIPMASVIALLASIGGAIALGLQGSLANIAAGVVLMVCKPIAVGDWIQVGEYSGCVTKIGLYYTTLRRIDLCSVEIPNGELVGKTVVNQSANGRIMGEIKLPVPYGTDVETLKPFLSEKAAGHPHVFEKYPVDVRLTEFEDSSMTVSVFFWMDPDHARTTRLDLTEQLKSVLDEKGISIPFPQIDVHMK